VAKGENRQQRRLSRSVFSSLGISQTGIDIENPYGENVHDMDENNIPEYRADPTVEGGVITVS